MTSHPLADVGNETGAHATELLNFALRLHEAFTGISQSQRLSGAINKLCTDFRFQSMHKLGDGRLRDLQNSCRFGKRPGCNQCIQIAINIAGHKTSPYQ